MTPLAPSVARAIYGRTRRIRVQLVHGVREPVWGNWIACTWLQVRVY